MNANFKTGHIDRDSPKSKRRGSNETIEEKTITPQLLEALRHGDHEAYKKVYIHYYGSICAFLQRLLRSQEEAEEIAQNIFLTVWERRADLDPAKNIGTFLYTIARNAVMNFFKHQKVIHRYHQLQPSGFESTVTAEDILIAQEKELLVSLAVQRMPTMRRRVFEMSRYEDMDNESIARELNISKENVANHLSQARKEIKQILLLFIIIFFPNLPD